MLSLRTSDDWTALSVDVTVAPDPAETFTNAATASSAYEAIEAWTDWLNDAGRAWSGVVTFAWTWARDTTTGGVLFTLTATGDNFTIDGGALSTLGFAAAGPVGLTTGTVALGTWAPAGEIAVARYMRQLGVGDASGDGVVRPGVPGAAHYRPTVSGTGTALDAARFGSIFADAENPRVAVVYQKHLSTWRTLAVGPITRARSGTMHYRFDLETLADVVA